MIYYSRILSIIVENVPLPTQKTPEKTTRKSLFTHKKSVSKSSPKMQKAEIILATKKRRTIIKSLDVFKSSNYRPVGVATSIRR